MSRNASSVHAVYLLGEATRRRLNIAEYDVILQKLVPERRQRMAKSEKKLYWVQVRHVGGAAERECVMKILALASNEKSALEQAKQSYLDWIGSRLELSAEQPEFIEAK